VAASTAAGKWIPLGLAARQYAEDVSRQTLWRYARAGILTARRAGHCWDLDRRDLHAFMNDPNFVSRRKRQRGIRNVA